MSPKQVIRWIYEQSVFAPITREVVGIKIMIAMFHRSTATLYLLYAVWGGLGFWLGVPTITESTSNLWQSSFSLLVFLSASIACFGATFFPLHARTELFAGSAFAGMAMFYVISLVVAGLSDPEPYRLVTASLVCSVIVIPLSRTMFIYKTLVRQSETT